MRKMLFKVETDVIDGGKIKVELSRKNGDVLHRRVLFGRTRTEAFLEVVSDYLLTHGLDENFIVRKNSRVDRPVWVWKEV